MKKFLSLALLIFISCGPTEVEIQTRIDNAIEEALLEIENENVDVCFLIVDKYINNVSKKHSPSLTVTDFENTIVDFILVPLWSTKPINFYGNLNNTFNNKKFNYEIYTVGYIINIPKNARYLKIYADYGNATKSNWFYEWDMERIEEFSDTQFFINNRVGLEGEDSSDLLTSEDFQSNWKSVRDSCEKFVKTEA